MNSCIRCIAAFALLASSLSAADVVVVDPAGGPGGALLQAAIDAAADGDILLLRAGDYTDVDIFVAGKVLSLVADPPGASVTLSRLRVDLPLTSGGTDLVRGLSMTPPALTATFPAGLAVLGNFSTLTRVWVEDCTATASRFDDGPGGAPRRAGSGFDSVGAFGHIVRCSATGADGFDQDAGFATGGGAGLKAFLGNLAVNECSFTGGDGGDGFGDGIYTLDGGAGLDGFAHFSVMGNTLQGGDEGDFNGSGVKPGPGALLSGGILALRDTVAQAGNIVGSGTPNVAVDSGPGLPLNFPAATRSLQIASPVREGALATLELAGEVGDGVWVYIGTGAGMKFVPYVQGAFVLDAPLIAPLFLGAITDPSGELDIGFTMPQLPAGMDGTVLFLQSAMSPAAGGVVTGSGSALVWIDSTL